MLLMMPTMMISGENLTTHEFELGKNCKFLARGIQSLCPNIMIRIMVMMIMMMMMIILMKTD